MCIQSASRSPPTFSTRRSRAARVSATIGSSVIQGSMSELPMLHADIIAAGNPGTLNIAARNTGLLRPRIVTMRTFLAVVLLNLATSLFADDPIQRELEAIQERREERRPA